MVEMLAPQVTTISNKQKKILNIQCFLSAFNLHIYHVSTCGTCIFETSHFSKYFFEFENFLNHKRIVTFTITFQATQDQDLMERHHR
jgi:hypothetical protein